MRPERLLLRAEIDERLIDQEPVLRMATREPQHPCRVKQRPTGIAWVARHDQTTWRLPVNGSLERSRIDGKRNLLAARKRGVRDLGDLQRAVVVRVAWDGHHCPRGAQHAWYSEQQLRRAVAERDLIRRQRKASSDGASHTLVARVRVVAQVTDLLLHQRAEPLRQAERIDVRREVENLLGAAAGNTRHLLEIAAVAGKLHRRFSRATGNRTASFAG